jgi:hypothetical protein
VEVSRGLGAPMPSLSMDQLKPEDKLQVRGW